ncbi:RpiR family transcriptional regulator, partial [Mycobacterium tuberculosis]
KKELGAALERGDALWEQHWNDAAAQTGRSRRKPASAA